MALWNSYQHQLRESRRNVRELDISGRAPHEAFDDGAFCTMGETCTTGSCGGGSAVTVDDRVGCTDYSCDQALDVVMNITNDANCDDSNDCTADACDEVLAAPTMQFRDVASRRPSPRIMGE